MTQEQDHPCANPPIRSPVDWGMLRRLEPISRHFGADRGTCIDRHYIQGFLQQRAADIRGRVLEIAEDTYTRRYGDKRVTQSDVLHVQGNRRATIVADLACGSNVPIDAFDCIILTQTLPFIFDARAALRTLHRALKPQGVLLATVPGISQISRYDMDRWGDFWRFSDLSARRLFEEVFSPEEIVVRTHGNVLTAIAFLHGLAAEELHQDELEHYDQDYPLIITIRAIKRTSHP